MRATFQKGRKPYSSIVEVIDFRLLKYELLWKKLTVGSFIESNRQCGGKNPELSKEISKKQLMFLSTILF